MFAIIVFIAGYITARYAVITQAVELAKFAWEHGVVVRGSLRALASVPLGQVVRLVWSRRSRLAASAGDGRHLRKDNEMVLDFAEDTSAD